MSEVAGTSTGPASHKRYVNDLIHESLREAKPPDPIGFFCECDSEGCFSTVWLTVSEYESARSDSEWSVRTLGH